jgi:hypothetical protein
MTALTKISDFPLAPSDFQNGVDTLVGVRPGSPNQDLRFSADQLQLGGGGLRAAFADMTFYVGPAGSDANDGLTSGTPFATAMKAVNTILGLNFQNAFTPSIKFLNGTYPGGSMFMIIPSLFNAAQLNLIYDETSTPGNVVISDTLIINCDPSQRVVVVGSLTTSNQFPFQVYSGIFYADNTLNYWKFTNQSAGGVFAHFVQNWVGFNGPACATIAHTGQSYDFTGCLKIANFVVAGGGLVQFVDPHVFFPAAPIQIVNFWAQVHFGTMLYFHSIHAYINGVAQAPNATGNATGKRLRASSGAIYNSFYGQQTDLPGDDDGAVDSTVTLRGDQWLPQGSVQGACATALEVLTGTPVAGITHSGTGDVNGNAWIISKDKTNGQRWLAVNDAGTPASDAVTGKVYLKQIGATFNTQTGASYTLALKDTDGVVEMNNAGANTLTVPPNSSVAFNIGDQISVVQAGAGTTTIAAGAGVTVRNAGAISGGQFKTAKLIQRAANDWIQINGAF